jgi:hypothetical protein
MPTIERIDGFNGQPTPGVPIQPGDVVRVTDGATVIEYVEPVPSDPPARSRRLDGDDILKLFVTSGALTPDAAGAMFWSPEMAFWRGVILTQKDKVRKESPDTAAWLQAMIDANFLTNVQRAAFLAAWPMEPAP